MLTRALVSVVVSIASVPVVGQDGTPAGPPWTVDVTETIAYPNWLHGGPHVRDEVRSILSSEVGNLQYWIRVAKGAKGQVVVAVGESHWSEPGHRIMDILIDGRRRAHRIDPIVHVGGKHRVGVVLEPGSLGQRVRLSARNV